MGLIRIAAQTLGSLGNAINVTGGAMWTDYFESGDMSGILMKRGEKISSKGSHNRGDKNIISSGSGIDVQENQCMILVEDGRIVDFCAEPGRYAFDDSLAPSLMTGKNQGLRALASMVGDSFAAGGSRTHTMRVFYINMGEIQGFKWGSGNIVFDHWERDVATGRPVWHIAATLRGNGVYSIQITDPGRFFSTIGAQKAGDDGDGMIRREDIEPQIKTEAIAAIRQGVGSLSALHIPYTEIAMHEADLTKQVNSILSEDWEEKRGFKVFAIAIGMMDVDDKSREKIENYEETRGYTDPSMLGAYMGMGQTKAMQAAASNPNGAVNGFAGMAMMNGMNNQNTVSDLVNSGMRQRQAEQANNTQTAGVETPSPTPQASSESGNFWFCPNCGRKNDGNFCPVCGTKKPENL